MRRENDEKIKPFNLLVVALLALVPSLPLFEFAWPLYSLHHWHLRQLFTKPNISLRCAKLNPSSDFLPFLGFFF